MPNGENSGDFIMKPPKLKDVTIDLKGSARIRARAGKAKKIKITVNIDADVLGAIKERSEVTGVPYQSLLNRMLRTAIQESRSDNTNRLDRLERELAAIKKKLTA